MDHEQVTEATLYMDEIEAHDIPVTRAQSSFLRNCRRRLAAGRLNEDDVRRLEGIIDDLDYRAERADGDDEYDLADGDTERWDATYGDEPSW